MFVRPALRLRRLLVMLCVAICGLLSAQTAMASIDRVQHGLGVEHAASAIAGAVVLDDHHDADHHHEAEQPGDQDSDHPPSHQHAGDHSQLLDPALPGVATPFDRRAATSAAIGSVVHVGLTGTSLERPPRG